MAKRGRRPLTDEDRKVSDARRKEKQRAYYAKNREKIIAYAKKRYAENSDDMLAKQRAYRAKKKAEAIARGETPKKRGRRPLTDEERKVSKERTKKKQREKYRNLSPEEKAQRKAYHKTYYAKKKAEAIARGETPKKRGRPKIYTDEEQREKERAYQAKYWRENKDKIMAKRKQRENYTEYQREYYHRKKRKNKGGEV